MAARGFFLACLLLAAAGPPASPVAGAPAKVAGGSDAAPAAEAAAPAGTISRVSLGTWQFTASTSTDGKNWTPVGGSLATIPALGDASLAGMASAESPSSPFQFNSAAHFEASSITVNSPTELGCPPSWQCADVSATIPSIGGDQNSFGDIVNVTAARGVIGGTSDTFHFVYHGMPSAGSPGADSYSAQLGSNGSEAPDVPYMTSGIMLRGAATPGSPYYGVFFSGTRLVVQWRTASFGTTSRILAPTSPSLPLYLRIDRAWLAGSNGELPRDSLDPKVSADGRYVVFRNRLLDSSGLDVDQILLRDRVAGTTTQIARGVGDGGAVGEPVISADGSRVAWVSGVKISTDGSVDPQSGRSLHTWDVAADVQDNPDVCPIENGDYVAGQPSISGDGRYLAFVTGQDCTADGSDTNGSPDVYVADLSRPDSNPDWISAGSFVAVIGAVGAFASGEPAISADGRFVAFTSSMRLPGQPSAGAPQVYRRDRGSPIGTGAATTLVSAGPDGTPGDRASSEPSISADGGVVAFTSTARSLVTGDVNPGTSVFAWQVTPSGTAIGRVSIGAGTTVRSVSHAPAVSGDGRTLAFVSNDPRLVAGDTNRLDDVFVRTLGSGATTVKLSSAVGGGAANGESSAPAVDGTGATVVFASSASNLIAADGNRAIDVFAFIRAGTISLSPVLGPPGIVTVVTGKGFPPGSTITLQWSRGVRFAPLSPVVVAADGSFVAQALVMPDDLQFGSRDLLATVGAGSAAAGGAALARASFLVVQHTAGPPVSDILRGSNADRPFFLRH